jgi:sugar (pentulose or hexulose) kinase
VVEGSGPFPDRKAHWSVPRDRLDHETAFVVTSFYLAMMTEQCLQLSGAAGETIVEGPFASNPVYLEMLAAATDRPVVAMQASATGTSIGAALLADLAHAKATQPVVPELPPPSRMAAMVRYADLWRTAVSGR